MKVRIYRYDEQRPSQERERYDTFEVPVPLQGDQWSVMDVLDYISLYLDNSLAYYKHSACNHGICGRCLVQVNGKPKLACLCIVDPLAPLTLEPALGRQKIRDLVTLENI